jgi:ribosomal 50S subunit-recycling heat shock protein
LNEKKTKKAGQIIKIGDKLRIKNYESNQKLPISNIQSSNQKKTKNKKIIKLKL